MGVVVYVNISSVKYELIDRCFWKTEFIIAEGPQVMLLNWPVPQDIAGERRHHLSLVLKRPLSALFYSHWIWVAFCLQVSIVYAGKGIESFVFELLCSCQCYTKTLPLYNQPLSNFQETLGLCFPVCQNGLGCVFLMLLSHLPLKVDFSNLVFWGCYTPLVVTHSVFSTFGVEWELFPKYRCIC